MEALARALVAGTIGQREGPDEGPPGLSRTTVSAASWEMPVRNSRKAEGFPRTLRQK
jgi:hypothetical protein